MLVTRPEPGAAETAARLAERGHASVLAPALVLTPLPHPPMPPGQALLLPSRAAARALLPSPHHVLAVGEATAEAARAQGFATVAHAGGDAAALLALVQARLDPRDGPLVLAAGQGLSLELAAGLRAAGFRVLRRVVYGAAPATAWPDEAVAALQAGRVSHALFFSPRSANRSMTLMEAAGLSRAASGVVALALSPRVAATLTVLKWRSVLVAPRPHQDSLLELLPPP